MAGKSYEVVYIDPKEWLARMRRVGEALDDLAGRITPYHGEFTWRHVLAGKVEAAATLVAAIVGAEESRLAELEVIEKQRTTKRRRRRTP